MVCQDPEHGLDGWNLNVNVDLSGYDGDTPCFCIHW